MTSGAVHRWNTEIQEGIFNMAELFIDMCVARLQHLPIHHEILNILTLVILYIFFSIQLLKTNFYSCARNIHNVCENLIMANVLKCSKISKFRITGSHREPIYLCLIAK